MSRKRIAPSLPEADAAPDRSRSQKKRESTAIQALGETLANEALPVLRKMDLPPDLLEAIIECQSMRSHEAKRRQMQYIGRLMRECDWRGIAERVAAQAGPQRAETARFHRLEGLRDALIAARPEAVAALIPEWSGSLPEIQDLAAAARAESAANKPPRASRALFRLLRELDSKAASEPDPSPGKASPLSE